MALICKSTNDTETARYEKSLASLRTTLQATLDNEQRKRSVPITPTEAEWINEEETRLPTEADFVPLITMETEDVLKYVLRIMRTYEHLLDKTPTLRPGDIVFYTGLQGVIRLADRRYIILHGSDTEEFVLASP